MEAFERAFGTEAENLAQRMERNDSKKEKTNPEGEGPQNLVLRDLILNLTSRVNQLEKSHKSHISTVDPVCRSLNSHTGTIDKHESGVQELQIKLKEAIVSVERLAKGKSLGALGLPPLEAWDPPA